MTIKDTLQNWIRETLDLDKDLNFTLEYPADASHGDFACNVAMILAKDLGKNPRELAEEFAEKLRGSRLPFIFDIEVAGPGFINIKLTPEIFSESIEKIIKAGEKIGEHNHYSGKRILVEHTATNAFKEFHVGHVMTNVIGESVSRIIEEEGAEVVRLSYHSDVGLNVAKAVCVKVNSQAVSLLLVGVSKW
jgi:arginyl-tRNA synthetase